MRVRRGIVVMVAVLAVLAGSAVAWAQSSFAGPVFGLASSEGRVYAADAGAGIVTLRGDKVMDLVPLPGATAVAPVGRDGAWATTGAGADPTTPSGQALWWIEDGEAELVADLWAFEVANNPDGNTPFDSNPYDVVALADGSAIVVDPGANAILRANRAGNVQVMAVFPDGLVSTANIKSLAGCPGSEAPFCGLPDQMPAQSTPTAAAVGADGSVYVGELRGFPGPTDASSIWKVSPGATGAQCGVSPDCVKVFDGGFTSIVDLEIDSAGRLFVAEMDERSWAAVEIFGVVEGGTVNRCNLTSLACEEIETDIPMLSAVTLNGRSLWATRNVLVPGGAEVIRLR